ncbi:hypothetical protein OAQ99_00670 [Candidatus Kapabacteria bacterium]|nr:hypothetical protein [Candidatus Kapabacteria bacterium]
MDELNVDQKDILIDKYANDIFNKSELYSCVSDKIRVATISN